MTALSNDSVGRVTAVKQMQFTLASGQKAYKGSRIALTLGAGTCVVVTATTGLFIIGTSMQQVDATAGAKTITVDLDKELNLRWFANHTVSAVASTDLGYLCYAQDDNTVTMLSTSRAIAGRVWGYDATKGVLVETLSVGSEYDTALAAARILAAGGTLTFAGGDVAPSAITSGALYACPATAAVSTITLPAADASGTWCIFQADGTANDFSVTFVDASGPTTISRVLPAGVEWQALCVKGADGWKVTASLNGNAQVVGTLPAPDTGNIAPTAEALVAGGVYVLPGLATNSTVTLPTTGVADYTKITVIADGTQGAYTTTYRYGTTAITTALTASKAHVVDLWKIGSKWFANAYVNA